MYKNQLQELAQRSCFNLPAYACIREGPDHAPRFKATVNFNGEVFESPNFCTTLRQAEHAAAEVALNTLSRRGPSRSLAAKVLDETGVYKNLLQETAHRAGLKLPVYTTIRSGPGHTPIFSCTVELAGMSFSGEPAKTKKQAQKNAAMAAWSALKQLPQSGSSCSSCSSPSDHEQTDEQGQITVARVLSSLCHSESNKQSLQTSDRHHKSHQRPVTVPHNRTNYSYYPMPFHNWAYPNLSPDALMYHMWHQAQASHLANARSIPFLRSMLQPSQSQLYPGIAQECMNPMLCFPRSTTPVLSNPSRIRSQVTIQEIHEEKTQSEDKEWLRNGNPDAINLQCDGSNRETDISHKVFDPLSTVSDTFVVKDPCESKMIREREFGSTGPRGFRPPQMSLSRARGPSTATPVTIRTQVPACSTRPSLVNQNDWLPPPVNFMAPPVHMRTVVPVCSAPPVREPHSAQKSSQDAEDNRGVSSEFSKLQI
ncbi:uncharacterized protein A4U43_C02F20750 [Asparagus officinalis]|uniref:DRBM domain-containing protein n=1 Tax=Asparagus officinalis TaxID=4686 RepID=A0A5P1FLM3_ASPOF|nr:double-stranded RNA-binding protein 2-like [Asparagus officinalis]XP_020254813.1 double-stranded RNA-binding protein 2-like [Asparagus officinalis]ONK78623.1 uncharacterized protein A4U43_C02F20750 [Asparagus officinalis]